jgi:hypothetical protein
MNGWEKMFAEWHKGYYSELFMFICELTAIILGLIYKRKDRIARFFIFYIILDITILVIDQYIIYLSGLDRKKAGLFVNILNSFVFLIELLVYFFFFQKALQSLLIKKTLSILRLVFIGLTSLYLLHTIIYNTTRIGSFDTYTLGVIEFFFLIVPCLFYFAELFSKPSERKLLNRPSFWIATGIFFYSFISIPYFFIVNYLFKSKYHYIFELDALLFCLPFGISFLFLSKAFTLKTELTT